jgi:hypothetical protein
MLVKIVTLFLLGMVLIGLLGKQLFPGAISRGIRQKMGLKEASRCSRCGRYLIGKDRCDCRSKG